MNYRRVIHINTIFDETERRENPRHGPFFASHDWRFLHGRFDFVDVVRTELSTTSQGYKKC
jgi:hypothetical protein